MQNEENQWRELHGKVIQDFLSYINRKTNSYVLKGGTALMLCYKLDRFSEDIDFDSINHGRIKKEVESFSKIHGYQYRTGKETETVQRFFINYGNDSHPLKIEVSYRKKELDRTGIVQINGICVYDINELFAMKLNAYSARNKIRDLYDITFMAKHYWEDLDLRNKSNLANALSYKGLEYFDYLIETQEDILIDKDALAADFLDIYDKAGLIVDQTEVSQNLTGWLQTAIQSQSGQSTAESMCKESDNYVSAPKSPIKRKNR